MFIYASVHTYYISLCMSHNTHKCHENLCVCFFTRACNYLKEVKCIIITFKFTVLNYIIITIPKDYKI